MRACVRASRIRVVLCVRDSAQTASHICTYLVPINCTIIVDVQHTFHFGLDLILDTRQGHKNLVFSSASRKQRSFSNAELSVVVGRRRRRRQLFT